MNYNFEKIICVGLAFMGGAAGEWVITHEFSTDFDEICIFVVGKDQTFRICATFPESSKIFHFSHTFNIKNLYARYLNEIPF